MNKTYKRFVSRCNSYQDKVDYLRANRKNYDDWTFNRLTEGLMSDLWQNWCHFCRSLLHTSCRGGEAFDSKSFSPRAGTSDNSWQRIGYEARQRNGTVKANGHHNFYMRNEPTWGDLKNIVDIINTLNPVNKNILLSAFGMGMMDIEHLQLARNAVAHKNVETITDLHRNMILYYNFSNLKNPSDLAWAMKRGTNTFAIYNWIYEMKIIAKSAVATC